MTLQTQFQCSITCTSTKIARKQIEKNCTSRHWSNDSPHNCQPSAIVGAGKTICRSAETQPTTENVASSAASSQRLTTAIEILFRGGAGLRSSSAVESRGTGLLPPCVSCEEFGVSLGASSPSFNSRAPGSGAGASPLSQRFEIVFT